MRRASLLCCGSGVGEGGPRHRCLVVTYKPHAVSLPGAERLSALASPSLGRSSGVRSNAEAPSRRWSRASRAAYASSAVAERAAPAIAAAVVAATRIRGSAARERTTIAIESTSAVNAASEIDAFSASRATIERPSDKPLSISTGSPVRARWRAISERTVASALVASAARAGSRGSSRVSLAPRTAVDLDCEPYLRAREVDGAVADDELPSRGAGVAPR